MLDTEYQAMLAVCIKSIADLEAKVRELEDRLRASCPQPEEAPRRKLRSARKTAYNSPSAQSRDCRTCRKVQRCMMAGVPIDGNWSDCARWA